MYESAQWLESKVDSYLFNESTYNHNGSKACCVVCDYLKSDLSVNEYVLKNEMYIHMLRRLNK